MQVFVLCAAGDDLDLAALAYAKICAQFAPEEVSGAMSAGANLSHFDEATHNAFKASRVVVVAGPPSQAFAYLDFAEKTLVTLQDKPARQGSEAPPPALAGAIQTTLDALPSALLRALGRSAEAAPAPGPDRRVLEALGLWLDQAHAFRAACVYLSACANRQAEATGAPSAEKEAGLPLAHQARFMPSFLQLARLPRLRQKPRKEGQLYLETQPADRSGPFDGPAQWEIVRYGIGV